jgi:hypothetical protein
VKSALDGLRMAILARHRTVYAFCRANPDLQRSTVYLILSGKYPGNTARQIDRITGVLTGAGPQTERRPAISAREAYPILQQAKCAHCRKLDKRGCPECNTQTAREAQALEDYMRGREL